MKNKKALLIIIIAGLFLFLDQFLKQQSLGAWPNPWLYKNLFGWNPFLNPGIAFGVPIPNWLVIILTIPIIALLIYLLLRPRITYHIPRTPYPVPELNESHSPASGTGYGLRDTGYALIFFGAVSNLIDRLLQGNTVDYFRLFTAVINLSDVMIVVGGVICFIYHCNTSTP